MESTPVSLIEQASRTLDAKTWGRLVAVYAPILDGWARELRLQEADAADLAQEVFLVLLRELPRFRYDPARSFRAWLRTVTLNKHRERARRAADRPMAPLPDDWADPAAANSWRPDERRQLVRAAALGLRGHVAPATWRAFWETAVEGRAADDVARDLNTTSNAVYLAKVRMLRRLQRELKSVLD